ncbi:hypothetical protein DID78_02420 [Candidatus Marinamargulisbacteria bacterium SCGC AG-343-D04]|nr:hypothetical protein DID78_02420 [Candidatus Marinamargulisbacteria bacterium SCGC AG-343-D04]
MIKVEELFDPFIYTKYTSFSTYTQHNSPEENTNTIRKTIEKVVLETLKRIGVTQCHYMVLADDFSGYSKEQIFSTFFNQACFQKDRKKYEQEASMACDEAIYNHYIDEYGLRSLTKEQCVYEMKQYSYRFKGYSLSGLKTKELNRMLTFIESSYYIIPVMLGSWYTVICGCLKEVNGVKNSWWIEKEFLIFPSVHQTLAALTSDQKIFLRKECFQYMVEMKWKTIDDYGYLSSFSDAYKISQILKERAVKNIKDKPNFESIICDRIGMNVFYHELGHVIINDSIDYEMMAIMKKLESYPMSLFDSVNECLADIAPFKDEQMGVLYKIALLSTVNKEKASDLFFTYASDTWFFDTSDKSMFEYSEMIHLILLRYLAPDQDILFDQMIKDFDLENPSSFLTRLIAILNTSIREFKDIVMKQNYIIENEQYSFKFIHDLAHGEVLKIHPIIDQESYDYYSFLWAKIIVLIKTFTKDKTEIDEFHTRVKSKVFTLLYSLNTDKQYTPDDAQNYIMSQYVKRLVTYEKR